MERLFYNCEKIKLSYYDDEENQIYKDVAIGYTDAYYPNNDNTTYLRIYEEKKKDPGTLLHVYIYDEDKNEEGKKAYIDKGLFIVDAKGRLVSITCGEQFYKPLYAAYDRLIRDINNI